MFLFRLKFIKFEYSTYCEEEESFLQYVKNFHILASSGDKPPVTSYLTITNFSKQICVGAVQYYAKIRK